MQRKKLLNLPIRTVRPDVPNMPKRGADRRINLCYDAFVDSSTGEDVLIIDFYLPKEKSLHKRLFFNGERWITEYANGTVSRESLMINRYWYHEYRYTPINDWCDMKIKSYMRGCFKDKSYSFSEHAALDIVSDYQDRLREKNLENRYQRIRESVSREMLEITPTPDKFIRWIDKDLMPKYLFYIYSKKKSVTAYCSYCGKTVTIGRPHSGDTVKCPHCNQKCTAKPYKQYKNTAGFNDIQSDVLYIQPLKNNRICIRQYQVCFYYYSNSTVPHKEYWEYARLFARMEHNKFVEESKYLYDSSYKGGDWRKDYCTYSPPRGYIYPSTLNRIFKAREGFKQYHIDFNRIARKCGKMKPNHLLYASIGVNSLMNLVNTGLYHLANDVIDIAHRTDVNVHDKLENVEYKNAGALKKAFEITKDDMPYLKHLDPSLRQFDIYIKLKKSGKLPNVTELKRYFQICDKLGQVGKLTDHLIEYSTIHQFIKYYDKLKKEEYFNKNYYGYNAEYYFLSDYFDYIRFAQLLEMNLRDLNVLYPRNFKKAHDSLSDIVNSKEFAAGELPQIARQYNSYMQLFGYTYKDLMIVPPTRHNDIKNEGKELKHCVASYAERVAVGKTIILFVRKASEPGKPYFTLNISPDTYSYIQCRGLQNCDYPKEVKNLIDKWYQEKIEPLRRNQQLCRKTA